MTSFPVLTVLWAVPMLGAVVVMVLPAAARALAKWVALAVSLVVLAVTAVIAVGFDPGGEQYQFVENYRWIPSFGTGYILGLDGIALALVLLAVPLARSPPATRRARWWICDQVSRAKWPFGSLASIHPCWGSSVAVRTNCARNSLIS